MIRAKLIIAALTAALLLPGSAIGAGEPFSRETPVVRAVRLAGPSVVNISTFQDSGRGQSPFTELWDDELFDDFFRNLFEHPRQRERSQVSLGSGVIIDGQKGLILTNQHVVVRASHIKVGLADDREFEAELVGSDPDSDLAVLRIKAGGALPALPMADSSDLMIGETVIAIGNPFGLTHTVTTGVISATNRTVRAGNMTYRDFIQTDASINPGNSGGPLLNINGQLIGINTAIFGGAEGIGFAIPISKAKRIVRDLISYGEVHPAWLGLWLQPLDERLAQYFKVPAAGGVVVVDVDKNGPAAGLGLARGDVIVKIGDSRIASIDDYEDVLVGYTDRDNVQLTYYRQGITHQVTVVADSFPPDLARQLGWDRYGLEVEEQVGDKRYVVVKKVRPGSAGSRIGLAPGDIFLRVNEIQIDSREAFYKAMARYRFRDGLSAVVQRGRMAYNISLVP